MEISQLSLIFLLFFSSLWGCLIGLLDNVNKALRIFVFENFELSKLKAKKAFFITFVFFQDFFASYVRARDLSSQLYEVVGHCPGRGCL